MESAGLDAIICGMPPYVLMLTGYWPVVGQSIAVATSEGKVGILAPKDEEEFARDGWADELEFFESPKAGGVIDLVEAMRPPFTSLLSRLGLTNGKIGYESRGAQIPSPYASVHAFNEDIKRLLIACLPFATLADHELLLANLASRKSPSEIERIQIACDIAERAFKWGREKVQAEMSELHIAANFRMPLSVGGVGYKEIKRADGFTYCMSGANGGKAEAAFQISSHKAVAQGETILVHCNSYADGFWTDITRTYVLGSPDKEAERALSAVKLASSAALNAIKAGALPSDIDAAGRQVLEQHGFGESAGSATGHEVGFQAISHAAMPIIQPQSNKPLEVGMVFNVEPGIYIPGKLGIRHCDMVAVTDSGYRMLTPF
jgi:Xaa-Pro aminopeptidase